MLISMDSMTNPTLLSWPKTKYCSNCLWDFEGKKERKKDWKNVRMKENPRGWVDNINTWSRSNHPRKNITPLLMFPMKLNTKDQPDERIKDQEEPSGSSGDYINDAAAGNKSSTSYRKPKLFHHHHQHLLLLLLLLLLLTIKLIHWSSFLFFWSFFFFGCFFGFFGCFPAARSIRRPNWPASITNSCANTKVVSCLYLLHFVNSSCSLVITGSKSRSTCWIFDRFWFSNRNLSKFRGFFSRKGQHLTKFWYFKIRILVFRSKFRFSKVKILVFCPKFIQILVF